MADSATPPATPLADNDDVSRLSVNDGEEKVSQNERPERPSAQGSPDRGKGSAADTSDTAHEVITKKKNIQKTAEEMMDANEALNDARRSSVDLERPPLKKLVSMESYPLKIALELLRLDRIKEIKGIERSSLEFAKAQFKKTKILYIFPDRESIESFTQKNKSNTFAPKWFEPFEYFQYTRSEYNTIVANEEGIDLIIDFVGINCTCLEAIYSEVTLPFNHFANRLGPKMSFFRGLDVRLRWRDYEMLSQFPKLQFMRGYGAPCYYQRLAKNLPVTVIDDFGLSMANKCGGCIKRVFQISRDLGIEVGRIRRGIPLLSGLGSGTNPHEEAEIDPVFANRVKELTLIHWHHGQSFFFPNLLSLALRSPKHGIYFKSIEYSVKLRSLELTLPLNKKCLLKLARLVKRLPELKLFFLFNYRLEGNTFPEMKEQENFLSNLVLSCPNLENLIIPFIISITSVKSLIRLHNLIFLGVQRFPMDSSIGFFSNTRGNKIAKITITEDYEDTETFDGTNILHSAFMKCCENKRYHIVNINYCDVCLDEGCPLKRFINTTSSSIKLTYGPE